MKLIVGIGIPGSGKSTYLKPLAEEEGLAYINPDEIREELTGDPTNHTKEPQVWALVHTRTKSALQRTGAVVDATYTKRSDRRQLIKLAHAAGIEDIQAYWFNVPLTVAKARNAARARKVPGQVLEAMYNRMTKNPPELTEGFSAIVEITD